MTRNAPVKQGDATASISLSKVRADLRYNPYSSKREKVLNALVLNPCDEHGQMVVAVVIPKKPRLTSVQVSERYHAKFTQESQKPEHDGKRIDYQFYYPGEQLPDDSIATTH